MLDSLDARIEVLQRLGDSSAASWDWLVEGINQLKIVCWCLQCEAAVRECQSCS